MNYLRLILKLKSKFCLHLTLFISISDWCLSFWYATYLFHPHFLFFTRYNDLKKGERLQELQEKLRLSESQLQSCDTRLQEISAELGRSNKLMESQEELRRNIDANLNYRKTKAEVRLLTQEVESLEAEILQFGEISKFEAELLKLSQERERLLSEVSVVLHYFLIVLQLQCCS